MYVTEIGHNLYKTVPLKITAHIQQNNTVNSSSVQFKLYSNILTKQLNIRNKNYGSIKCNIHKYTASFKELRHWFYTKNEIHKHMYPERKGYFPSVS